MTPETRLITTIGPNAAVKIQSGVISSGVCDSTFPAADVYVVKSGTVFDGMDLVDVSNGKGNWHFNWKTPKGDAGQCRTMSLKLNDGTPGWEDLFVGLHLLQVEPPEAARAVARRRRGVHQLRVCASGCRRTSLGMAGPWPDRDETEDRDEP